jgi:hypothetical protein
VYHRSGLHDVGGGGGGPLTAPSMDADGRSSNRTLFPALNELPARLGVSVLPQGVARIHLISVWSTCRQTDGILCNEEQVRLDRERERGGVLSRLNTNKREIIIVEK